MARVAQKFFNRLTLYKRLFAYQAGLRGFMLTGGLNANLLPCLDEQTRPIIDFTLEVNYKSYRLIKNQGRKHTIIREKRQLGEYHKLGIYKIKNRPNDTTTQSCTFPNNFFVSSKVRLLKVRPMLCNNVYLPWDPSKNNQQNGVYVRANSTLRDAAQTFFRQNIFVDSRVSQSEGKRNNLRRR